MSGNYIDHHLPRGESETLHKDIEAHHRAWLALRVREFEVVVRRPSSRSHLADFLVWLDGKR